MKEILLRLGYMIKFNIFNQIAIQSYSSFWIFISNKSFCQHLSFLCIITNSQYRTTTKVKDIFQMT